MSRYPFTEECMMQKRLSLKTNTILNSVGSMFYLTCQWLISVLAVRLGSYDAGGIYSLALSITNVFFVMSTFAIRHFQVSDTSNKYSSTRYITTRVLTCGVGLTCCVIFTLLNSQYTAMQSWCIVLCMVFRLSEAMVDTLAAEEQKAWRMDYICVSFVLRGVLTLGGFVIVMATTHSLPLAMLTMAVLPMLVVIFHDGRTVRRIAGCNISVNWQETLSLLKEAFPLMCSSVMMTLLTTIPRYMLEYHAGSEVLGVYGALATPAVIVQMGCSFIYSPLVAPLSENWYAGKKKEFRATLIKAVGVIVALTLLMLAGASLLGCWGLNLLFGESILAYAWLLIPVLLTSLCSAMMYFFEVPLTILRRQKLMATIHAAATIATVVLSVKMIPSMGMMGVNLVMYLCAGGAAVGMGVATFILSR